MDEAELTAIETALRERAEALEVRITGMATPPERGPGSASASASATARRRPSAA
jgi:hypothetical protein